MKNVRGFGRLALVSALVAAGAQGDTLPGLGQTAAPRVLVIMDTSRSMTESPDGGAVATSPGDGTVDSNGGDYDCSAGSNPTCVSKFCSAKQTLCEVLPQFQTVQFGLGGYYQYVANASRAATTASQCLYDVLEPPGITRTFSTSNDLTGSYTTLGTTATVNLGSGGYLPGCGTGSAESYPVTKIAQANLGGLVASGCTLMNTGNSGFNPTPVSSPGTIAATVPTGCSTTTYYELPLTRSVTPNIAYMVGPSAACPGSGPVANAGTGNIALGTPYSMRVTSTAPPSCAGNTATGCFTGFGAGPAVGGYTLGPAINGSHCTGTYPCDLYLVNSNTVGGRAWYGLYDPATFTPDGGYPGGPVPGYNWDYPATHGNTGTQVLTGNVNMTSGSACVIGAYNFGTTTPTTLRVNNGTLLSAFGIANAQTTVDNSATIGLTTAPTPPAGSTRVDDTPTATGGTFTCAGGWPCDVTLTTIAAATANPVTVYSRNSACTASCTVGSIGTCAWTASGTTGTYLTTRAADGGCAASFTANSATVTPPQGTFITTGFTTVGASPPTDCSAATDMTCTFFGSGTVAAPTPRLVTLTPSGCTNPVTTWNATTPTFSCPQNGNSYSGPTTVTNTTPTQVTYASTGGTTACPATASVWTASPGTFTLGTACSGSTSTNPCTLSNTDPGNSVTAAPVTTTTTNPTAPGGTGWTTPGPTVINNTNVVFNGTCSPGTSTCNTNVSCSNPVGSTGNYLGTGNYVQSLGAVQRQASGCGLEGTDPCMACGYTPVQYTWTRYQSTCHYSATQRSWTVNTMPACRYTRQWYNRSDCLAQCGFSATASRYDFAVPVRTQCNYTAVGENLQTQGHTYTYSYLTKGGELYGRFTKDLGLSTACDGTNTYQADGGGLLAGSCPALIPECVPATARGSTDAGFTCKLMNSTTVTGPAPDRYSNFSSASSYFGNLTAATPTLAYWSGPASNADPTRQECLMSDSALGTPDTATLLQSRQAAYCRVSGSSADEQYKLISDWYDPAITENVSTVASQFPAGYTVTWSKPANDTPKTAGLSVWLDGGSVTPSMIFVGIDPLTFDPVAQQGKLMAALKPCNYPSAAHGNVSPGSAAWDTADSGFCYSQAGDNDSHNPTWSTLTDYTPLYGSLQTASDYLKYLVANDSQWQCRGYYLLLATDGQENTPHGYNGTDLANLVSSFRNLSAGGHTVDLKTYVVGFGGGATSDLTVLNAMASAGGTGAAYGVSSQAALENTLRTIFASLTAGVFTRSKPTIATDGSRLYASYFTVLNTDEWAGELAAYKINADGTFNLMWNASSKVNDTVRQLGSARVLRVAVDGQNDRNFDTTTLGTGPGTLGGLITADSAYPGGLAASTVVNFIRNDGLTAAMSPTAFATRNRTSRLAGIVHSNPVVVGVSPYDPSWGGLGAAQTEFTNYVSATRARGPRVLSGSMDGFLRAFREGTGDSHCGLVAAGDGGTPTDFDPACPNGQEAWGFMPSAVVPQLYKLRDGFSGTAGVDGLVAVADVCAASGGAANCAQANWRTVAIGSERMGGRELFALDITAASDAGIGPAPGYLWGFTHTDLGYSYSTPAIGRVRDSSGDRFVAIFGAGRDDPSTGNTEGPNVFVVDAIDGGLIGEYDEFSRISYHRRHSDSYDVSFGNNDQKYTRPGVHRYPGEPHLFAAYVPGVAGTMYAMRFMNGPTTITDPDEWEPEELWNPQLGRSGHHVRGTDHAPFTQVVDTTDGGAQPTFALADPSLDPAWPGGYHTTLPLASGQVRPLLNRPKVVPVLDATGKLPDLFFGTGDSTDPGNPGASDSLLNSLQTWNYFVAVHDNGSGGNDSLASGSTMWAHYFIDFHEQVVSEPAVISGGVIVATYTPSAMVTATDGGFNCATVGQTTLYCFNPTDGSLVDCLIYNSGPWAGRSTSVLHLGSVGIPSDMLVVNNNLYFATSSGGLTQQPIRQTPPAGDIRSYRRLR